MNIHKMFANVNADTCLITNPITYEAGYGIINPTEKTNYTKLIINK
ncbi:hypothetical protein [Putridiphycobacter roseus]|nr:hypothetical protein [Putridiphycobacter roseus]